MSEARPEEGVPGIPPAALGIGRLFESVRDAVIVADAETGLVVAWNRAAALMLGHDARDAVGMPLDRIVPERLRAEHAQGMRRYRATGHGRYIDSGDVLELPALRKDGEEILIEMTLSPIREQAEGRYVLAILRDVTERVHLSRAVERERARLLASNAQMARVNEALEAFTYLVGHDLKEPARAVDALLGALEEDHAGSWDPEARALLQQACRANRRLRALLDGLLDFSRASLGPIDLVPVDPRGVLESDACRAQFEHLLEERGAQLVVDAAMPRVMATDAALCQLLGNLVTNAIRHNPRPDPLVRVWARPREEEVDLVVEDNGPGFHDAALRRLREQPAPGGTTGRSGFGLAIARRTAERLSGRLEVGNAPAGGARVGVTLRAAPPRAD